jgi:peptidoglycan/xylan/chitin deacetylase (PgdA/CDA1 family)
MASPTPRTLCVAASMAAALWLAGCSTPPAPVAAPPVPPPSAAPSTVTVAPDNSLRPGVLGRNERFIVYQPRAGETLRSIAASLLGSEERAWMIADTNDLQQPVPGQPLIVPLKPLNPKGVSATHFQTVPILCYHRFGGAPNRMAISPSNFEAQLDWLADNGFHVIRLSQLIGFLEGREALPKRSVVITIDDGYASVHRHALPALRKHNFPATLFAYSDFVGNGGDALTWQQMRDLLDSGLVDIQSHSKSHRNLIERLPGETDERYRQAIEAEVKVPSEVLERRLPVKIKHYAFPYGDANALVLEMLEKYDFELGVTVNPGGNPFFAQPLMLRRTMIFGDHSLEAFKARLQIQRAIAP